MVTELTFTTRVCVAGFDSESRADVQFSPMRMFSMGRLGVVLGIVLAFLAAAPVAERRARGPTTDRDEGARGVRRRALRRGAGAVREAVRGDAAPGLPAQHRALPPEDAPARQGDRRVQRVPREGKEDLRRRAQGDRRLHQGDGGAARRAGQAGHAAPAEQSTAASAAGDADRNNPPPNYYPQQPPSGTPTTSGTLVSQPPPPPPAEQPIYKKWWFWTGIGVVVAGGVVAAVVLSSGGTDARPAPPSCVCSDDDGRSRPGSASIEQAVAARFRRRGDRHVPRARRLRARLQEGQGVADPCRDAGDRRERGTLTDVAITVSEAHRWTVAAPIFDSERGDSDDAGLARRTASTFRPA